MDDDDQALNTLDGIKLVPQPSENQLNERQILDYRTEQEQCLDWLLTFGNEPAKAGGYANDTVKKPRKADWFV